MASEITRECLLTTANSKLIPLYNKICHLKSKIARLSALPVDEYPPKLVAAKIKLLNKQLATVTAEASEWEDFLAEAGKRYREMDSKENAKKVIREQEEEIKEARKHLKKVETNGEKDRVYSLRKGIMDWERGVIALKKELKEDLGEE